MIEKPERDFRMDDNVMLKNAQAFKNIFVEHKIEFTNKYTAFADPFESDMQDEIDVCEAAKTDIICRAILFMKTDDVNKKMDFGRNGFQTVLIYLKQAYPDNKAVLKSYGQHLYEKCRNSHTKFPVLLMQAYEMASDPAVKPLLMAKGATATQIYQLKTDSISIQKAVRIQLKTKGSRGLSAQDRVINLNKVWARMTLLSRCSKDIYKDNPVMRKLFLLYRDEPSGILPSDSQESEK